MFEPLIDFESSFRLLYRRPRPLFQDALDLSAGAGMLTDPEARGGTDGSVFVDPRHPDHIRRESVTPDSYRAEVYPGRVNAR
jgi:hypothetical protein